MPPSQPTKKQRIKAIQASEGWRALRDVGPSHMANSSHSVRKGPSRSNAEETPEQAGHEMQSTWFDRDDHHDAQVRDPKPDPSQDRVGTSTHTHEARSHEHRGQKRLAPPSRAERNKDQKSRDEERSLGGRKAGHNQGQILDKESEAQWRRGLLQWKPRTLASQPPLLSWLYSHKAPSRLRWVRQCNRMSTLRRARWTPAKRGRHSSLERSRRLRGPNRAEPRAQVGRSHDRSCRHLVPQGPKTGLMIDLLGPNIGTPSSRSADVTTRTLTS